MGGRDLRESEAARGETAQIPVRRAESRPPLPQTLTYLERTNGRRRPEPASYLLGPAVTLGQGSPPRALIAPLCETASGHSREHVLLTGPKGQKKQGLRGEDRGEGALPPRKRTERAGWGR